ncbi:MAG TPA: nuclear transport factor 2 family protein [Sphingomonadaceae bacterium]|nr:nuclear transport factor 2 family protein [Sphingomonadaceae bacterium]
MPGAVVAEPAVSEVGPDSPASVGMGRTAEVIAHPDPLSLVEDSDPAVRANKQLAFDMWRSVVNAGHVELADQMLQEGYIQHSPVLPTGRAAFKAIFSAIKRRDIPPVVSPPLVSLIGQNDLVVMALREELPEPGGTGNYTTTHFNLFRVEDGRLAEHWHSVQNAPGPNVLPSDQGGPQRVTGRSGIAQFALLNDDLPQQAANKRLVFDAWRQLHDAGREELAEIYIDPDFIEHDPNFTSGRASFVKSMSRRPDLPIETSLQTPIVAMVAQGDLVVLVTALEHPHPIRSAESYTTTWFDMFRISNNKIAEHWNAATKPNTPTQHYGD